MFLCKQVFDKLKQSYEAVEIDIRDDTAAIQEILGEITGAKTVSDTENIFFL